MDPFTQRMLERARARQEKIDQKLASSGQVVPKRKPLSENVSALKSAVSPVKSPVKAAVDSPKKSFKDSGKSPRRSSQKADVLSPMKVRNDVIVTKKEFRSPRGSRGSSGRRNSDVSVEINIMHRNDIQIEVQVEERDAPIAVTYDANSDNETGVTIQEIEEDTSKMEKENKQESSEPRNERGGGAALRHNFKSRLDRLGNLYSDKPTLSSPIHRTEGEFSAGTPPPPPQPHNTDGKKKFGRLAALADQINNWEDDLTHHTYQPEPAKKTNKAARKNEKLESSTLDVSIHSIKDIDRVVQANVKSQQTSKSVNSRTFTKPSSDYQRLDKNIVAELEPRHASTTPSAAAAPNMAAMVASPPVVTKKPSIKKYKAPTPPRKVDDECDSDKDKENNAVQNNDENEECKQTKPADEAPASPVVKRVLPKLNGNVDRSSVLSKAAMFEAGSPRAKEKDPAEMSLRERKALFEKNKGAAIVPKAPFGLAPSVKTLHGDNKAKASTKPSTPTKPVLPKPDKEEDTISQSSLGGGIKDKLAALLSKEQTISETTIQNKFRQEREREMEMLNNRFHYQPKPETKPDNDQSDDEQSDTDPSEKAPLMGSTTSLAQAFKKPEIIANIPKLTADKELDKDHKVDDKVVGTQPAKRRSSQDSPVVLSVLEDVKRIKVNSNKKEANGAVLAQPTSLYPHLSDIETDNSHTQEEYSDCGGSRCGYYTLECVFFFLCI